MMKLSVFAFSVLLGSALSAPVKAKDESETKFDGDDFHIMLPSLKVEITFRSSLSSRTPDEVLMRGGTVISPRAKLNIHLSHLILENVGEADEGVYTVKNPDKPEDLKRIKLVVRDCSNEENVMYGDNYNIQLLGVTPPITLEYRPLAVEANLTSRPGLVLLTSAKLPREDYQGRITANDRHVTLSTVTGADEGSYTVSDVKGVVKRKVCLNVKDHHYFEKLPYDGTLKINLILNSTLVRLYYSTDNYSQPRLLVDKGELTDAQVDLGLEGRLSVEGSVVVLEKLRASDVGQFNVIDILGFPVSSIHLELEPYRLPLVIVAVIALCGLLVFLLLVCLLSCLVKVKKRAKRAEALEKIAQNAGKEDDGDTFRQVVKNITQLNEESKHSQADNTEKSQSTEVDIKGLEVSSKEVGVGNLETSDSGVGFNTTALPLDTDTDAPDQIPESEAVSISVAGETESSPPAAAEPKLSAPPALEIKPIADTKQSPVAESKSVLEPETKKTSDLVAEPKIDVPKLVDVKLSPIQSPDAKLSPGGGLDAKTPEPKPAASPGPEPKPMAPLAPSPQTATKTVPTPAPEPMKPPTVDPVPITNGTPEPAADSKPTPEPADLINGSAPKATLPKTPEMELKSSGPALGTKVDAPASKDGALAEESSTPATT